jgi:hypothetical protein
LDSISATGFDGEGWSWELAVAIESCRDVGALTSLLAAEVARYGYTAAACGVFAASQGPQPVYLLNDRPETWIRRYAASNFAAHDFIAAEARRRLRPYTWETARTERQLTPQEEQFWSSLTELGWSDGISIPVHGPGGYCAFLTMAGGQTMMPPGLPCAGSRASVARG